MTAKTSAVRAAAIASLLAAPAFAQWGVNTAPQSVPGGIAARCLGRADMGQWGTGHRLEGRIASLKAELKISPRQEKLWGALADALRADAQTVPGEMMATAAAANLPERLAADEKLMGDRLSSLRRYKAAVDPLYAALSETQKKAADQLLTGLLGRGMMPEGCGMGE